jgi:hypothetical protein
LSQVLRGSSKSLATRLVSLVRALAGEVRRLVGLKFMEKRVFLARFPAYPATRRQKNQAVTLMEPNDLPIVVLPLELSDDSVANLIDFLRDLIEGLERHYAGASTP